MPPPPPPSESALHAHTALRLVTAVVRAGFDSTDDVLRLARRFDVFGQMRQHEPIDATCSEFAEKLLSYRGEICPGFFQELYQQAPSLSWATIRELTRTIAGVELASEAPPREHPEHLAQIRIELDAPKLTPAEGKALLARLEALFPAPTIRTFRFEQREHSVHALLCLPASAARILRHSGPRGLSRETSRPIRRVVETSSLFILAWTMGSWWLRERGWTLIFLTPVAVAATLLAEPAPQTLITHAAMLMAHAERDTVIVERDTVTRERDAVRNTLQGLISDPTAKAALLACQDALANSISRADHKQAIDAIATSLATCKDALIAPDPQPAACADCEGELAECKSAASLHKTAADLKETELANVKAANAALTTQVDKLKNTGLCPLPDNWTAKKGILRSAPICGHGSCTAILQSGQVLTWLPPAQFLAPNLQKGDRVCAEGPTNKANQLHTPLLVPMSR